MSYLLITFIVLYVVLSLWAIIDILSRIYRKDTTINHLWVLFIFIFPLLGSIIYFHMKHKNQMRQSIYYRKS